MNTASKEQKVTPSSPDELSIQILSENTPLMFQWLPKSYGASVPNNEQYPYMQRLVNWAEREPQRKIYLVVNGAGLKQGQIEKLREDLNPASNIQVVDYQQMSKEVGFKHLEVYIKRDKKQHKLSELLEQMYDQQSKIRHFDKFLYFSNILDVMRLEMLLNIEKITSTKEAIYFDFDILPKGDQQIGPISIPGDILLSADADSKLALENRKLENSIIGVNSKSQNVIKNMCKYVEHDINYRLHNLSKLKSEDVYIAMTTFIGICYYDKQGEILIDNALTSLPACAEATAKYWHLELSSLLPKEWYNQFRFEKNCKNVVVTSDKTWKASSNIYLGEELPLRFNSMQEETITASALPSFPTHLNHLTTESTAVIDYCAAISKEIIESLLSKKLYEDCSIYGDSCSIYENI